MHSRLKRIMRHNFFRYFGITARLLSYRLAQPVTKIRQYPSGDAYSLCPRCDSCIDREYTQFCCRCGQRLGWQHLDDAIVCPVTGITNAQTEDNFNSKYILPHI